MRNGLIPGIPNDLISLEYFIGSALRSFIHSNKDESRKSNTGILSESTYASSVNCEYVISCKFLL